MAEASAATARPPGPGPLWDRKTALAFLGYLLLSCAANAIVLVSFTRATNAHIPWNLQELHTQGWMMHALLTDPASFPHVNYFYPTPYAISLSEPRMMLALLGLPAYLLSGSNIAAFNLAFLLVIPLCGLGAFLACRAATGHATASFVGGLMFAFSPFQIGHLYQAVLLQTFFVPPGLAAAWALGRRPTLRAGALLGLCGGLQLLACAHFATYLAYGAAGVLLASMVVHRAPLLSARTWAALLLAAVVGVLVSAWVVIPFYQGYKLNPQMANDWKSMSGQNADLLSFWLPPPNTGPISAHSRRINGWLDTPGETLFPGLLALGLSLIWAFDRARRGAGAPRRRPALVALWLLLLPAALYPVALIPKGYERPDMLGLGTALSAATLAAWALLGLRLRLLAGLAAWWRGCSSLERVVAVGLLVVFIVAQGPVVYLLGKPLGFGLGFFSQEYFPGVKASRVPTRVWVLGAAGFAVLAALGYAVLSAQLSRLQSAALVAVLCWGQLATYPPISVINLDFEVRERSLGPVQLDADGIPTIYRWVAGLPGKPPILSLPVGPFSEEDHEHNLQDRSLESLYMYFSLRHFKPLVGGVTSYFPNWYLYKLKNRYSVPFPDEPSLRMFERLGVKYALVHKHLYAPEAWARVKAQLDRFPDRLRLAREEGGVLAYALLRAGQPDPRAVQELLSYQQRYMAPAEEP